MALTRHNDLQTSMLSEMQAQPLPRQTSNLELPKPTAWR